MIHWHVGNARIPKAGSDLNAVDLWRVDEDLGGPGKRVPPLPNGAVGYLYESASEEDVAEWAIVWSDPLSDACNQTALRLFMGQKSKAEGIREIRAVARSLVEVARPDPDAAPD